MSIPLNKIMEKVTPLFDSDMGFRLSIARMHMGLDQKQLGDLLGVNQQIISKMELGRPTLPAFTLARFVAILGEASNYVLIGTRAEKYDWQRISKRYWQKRNARPAKHGLFRKKEYRGST